MKNTYYIFEIEDESQYLFSDIGIDNNENLSYDKLHLWRFYNENVQIHFLQIANLAFCQFGKSEKLLKYLLSKGVNTNEFEIESIENNKKFVLSNNHQFTISDAGAWGCRYYIDKGGKTLFNLDVEKRKDQINIFNKKVSLKFKGTDDKSGRPPKEVEDHIKVQEKDHRSTKVKRGFWSLTTGILVGILFLVLILALASRFNII